MYGKHKFVNIEDQTRACYTRVVMCTRSMVRVMSTHMYTAHVCTPMNVHVQCMANGTTQGMLKHTLNMEVDPYSN